MLTINDELITQEELSKLYETSISYFKELYPDSFKPCLMVCTWLSGNFPVFCVEKSKLEESVEFNSLCSMCCEREWCFRNDHSEEDT